MENNNAIAINNIVMRFQNALPKLMRVHTIPGLTLTIFKDGKIVSDMAFGVKNNISQEPVIQSTIFEAASLSKPIIAYAALKLCESGVLNLDMPLNSYCPMSYRNNPDLLSQVTLRQILMHTAGFPTVNLKEGELLNLFSKPGTAFAYSGEGFVYLAFIIEHITGMPLAEYIQKQVFNPLGMNNSSFIWQDSYELQTALPHNFKGKPLEKWRPYKAVASCSLHTTTHDYALFMTEVIRQSQEKRAAFTLMLQPQVPINETLSWGLGWGIENNSNGQAFWHSGDNGAFKCLAAANQSQNLGFVMMTNSPQGFKLCRLIIEQVIGNNYSFIEWEEFDTYSNEVDDAMEERLSDWWKDYQ